jgi:hypothetical protein
VWQGDGNRGRAVLQLGDVLIEIALKLGEDHLLGIRRGRHLQFLESVAERENEMFRGLGHMNRISLFRKMRGYA